MKKLYVTNIAWKANEEDLKNHFSKYGNVASAKIITDRDTGKSRGFGFVEFSDRTEGEIALSAADGSELLGRQIKVQEAKK